MNILRRHTIALILLTVFVSMTMGGVFSYQMMMQDGTMHDCPYMGIAVLCDMTPLTHLSKWQNMFSATVQVLVVLALLLLLAAFITSRFVQDLFLPMQSPPRAVSRYRYRESITDPLRLAFARGLIHPKIF
ncbi:hypothetical protein HZC00_03480 [Candidatus Kaiserbacteria bacterium]|nr:hypothetical protein [Candidatus Kaiserbacteria bacterium]